MTALPLGKSEPVPEFEALYDQHFVFVWKSLRRLGVPPGNMDDAAQDVFLVVHRKLEGFEGRSTVRTWLFGIAHLVALGYRKQRVMPAAPEPPDELASPGASPLERAAHGEALRFVEGFLDTLDDLKRPIFILAELEQMHAPEIADALGVKLNTVYSRLRLARQAFQAALKRRGREVPP